MSDFTVIGGVSATLQRLLQDRMDLPTDIKPADFAVTVGAPAFSPQDNEPHIEKPRINLFLYRVTENGYLQNQQIPGRGSSSGYGQPPLSLNLHYMLTAYGNKQQPQDAELYDDLYAHFLLGSAMRVLHDIPVLNESLTSTRSPSGDPLLDDSLRNRYEQVKLSLEPLTLEDTTKVWTALALRYRLSAAYAVNVVQIESKQPPSFPRPVGQPASPVIPPPPTDQSSTGPHVIVTTIQPPTITTVWVRRAGQTTEQRYPYARIGDTLVIYGTALAGRLTSVGFGDLLLPADEAAPDRVEVVLTDNEQLQPGVRTVKVVTRDPAAPLSSLSSNEAPFVLVPGITTVALAAGPPRTLTVTGTRLLPPGTGGELVIGRSLVSSANYLTSSPTSITIPVPETLPARGVPVLIGGKLADPVTIDTTHDNLKIQIGTASNAVTASFKASEPRDTLAAKLQALIRGAAKDLAFSSATVQLCDDRLVVLAGDLASTVAITAPSGGNVPADLGLTAAQPAGAASAAVSGIIGAAPALSSATPRLRVQVGAEQPVDITIQTATSVTELAADLQAQLASAGAPAYQDAQVIACGGRLIVIPGVAAEVTFGPTVDDQTTVAELQLQAAFAVRVRANGAESIDAATVKLPQ